ncbi:DUF5134 domain-containing protein [Streptomyces gilvosporeus]|uniref:DUF5134 domain-containing protein n=1 Tax=Streptomyces gilvosporeus TaxID=553510 RepID=A0A1V0TMV1_9ACTN|nr:DUF5134 domain-containing protein [Streptomyces gilvosporeus]ARF54275.1 DUF5134 domain-containing protein [Streptomyces gilvosporeus]
MHGSAFVGWLLVVLCGAAGAYCLLRMRTGSAAQRAELRGEGLMGLGMAVMALPASAFAPPSWSSWLFVAGFGAMGVWALMRRHLHHAVDAVAMVYMALAMVLGHDGSMSTGMGVGSEGAMGSGGPVSATMPMGSVEAMSHGTPGGMPLLTGLLLAYYIVFVLAAGVRLVPPAVVSGGPVGAVACVRPPVVAACRVAMGLAMVAMLLTM